MDQVNATIVALAARVGVSVSNVDQITNEFFARLRHLSFQSALDVISKSQKWAEGRRIQELATNQDRVLYLFFRLLGKLDGASSVTLIRNGLEKPKY